MVLGRFVAPAETTVTHEVQNGNDTANQASDLNSKNGQDPSVLTAELHLERLHLSDALSARDAVAQHLAEACISIQEKTESIRNLEQEKADLETQLSFVNGRQEARTAPPGGRVDRFAREREYTSSKIQVEVGNLAETLRELERENKQLKAQINGEQPDGYQQGRLAPARPSDWQVSLHRILRFAMPPTSIEANNDGSSTGQPAQTAASATGSIDSPIIPTPHHTVDSIGCPRGHEEGTPQPAPKTASPDERLHARNAILNALPPSPSVPAEVLKPIVIPSQFTFQDFVTTLPVALRQQMGSYRLLRDGTTSWYGEREEHGYFLAPLFKCATNPRATTVHRWSTVDLGPQLDMTTECFYHKNGYWYYTGLYKAFWLDELSPAEWGNLSTETAQALVKQTIAARKNTTPQNVYETGQLYAAGALRVACIGLQCVGFSHAVYTQLIEAAERCAQTGNWRNTQTAAGSIWTPPSPNLSPGALATTSLSPRAANARSPRVQSLSSHGSSPSPHISILSSKQAMPAALADPIEFAALDGDEVRKK